jgi:hypothetical protein
MVPIAFDIRQKRIPTPRKDMVWGNGEEKPLCLQSSVSRSWLYNSKIKGSKTHEHAIGPVQPIAPSLSPHIPHTSFEGYTSFVWWHVLSGSLGLGLV